MERKVRKESRGEMKVGKRRQCSSCVIEKMAVVKKRTRLFYVNQSILFTLPAYISATD